MIRRYAAALDERYALTAEDWVDHEIRGGRDRELIGDLSALVDRFPLRERLRGQLITVLARAGRRADALAEYRRTRAVLREELGIEPGPDLQELHRRILTDEAPTDRRRTRAGALPAPADRRLHRPGRAGADRSRTSWPPRRPGRSCR